jgi:hypothetical protein
MCGVPPVNKTYDMRIRDAYNNIYLLSESYKQIQFNDYNKRKKMRMELQNYLDSIILPKPLKNILVTNYKTVYEFITFVKSVNSNNILLVNMGSLKYRNKLIKRLRHLSIQIELNVNCTNE